MNLIFASGAWDYLAPDSGNRRFFALPHIPKQTACQLKVEAWFAIRNKGLPEYRAARRANLRAKVNELRVLRAWGL